MCLLVYQAKPDYSCTYATGCSPRLDTKVLPPLLLLTYVPCALCLSSLADSCREQPKDLASKVNNPKLSVRVAERIIANAKELVRLLEHIQQAAAEHQAATSHILF